MLVSLQHSRTKGTFSVTPIKSAMTSFLQCNITTYCDLTGVIFVTKKAEELSEN